MHVLGGDEDTGDCEDSLSETSCDNSPPESPKSCTPQTFETFSDSDVSPPPFSPLSLSLSHNDDSESDSDARLSDVHEDVEVEKGSTDDNWCGFIFTGDNLDRSTKPTYQRQEQKALSLHYFHSFAVKDRVNLQDLSNEPPDSRILPDPEVCLPSRDDISAVTDEMCILLSRYNYPMLALDL